MEIRLSREEGHAHVAAVRVLQYRTKRPPTIDEIAEILGSKTEITNHRLRALAALGILKLVENPFETHVSVADAGALETLPEEVSEAGLSDAVAEFKKKQSAKADEMVRIFEESDEAKARREKNEKLAEGLQGFRQKKPGRKAPWEK